MLMMPGAQITHVSFACAEVADYFGTWRGRPKCEGEKVTSDDECAEWLAQNYHILNRGIRHPVCYGVAQLTLREDYAEWNVHTEVVANLVLRNRARAPERTSQFKVAKVILILANP